MKNDETALKKKKQASVKKQQQSNKILTQLSVYEEQGPGPVCRNIAVFLDACYLL